jgi:predicted ABC-type exoprotein transport system permease subunit
MKSLVDVLLVILAIAGLGFAIYEFLDFVNGKDTGFTRSLLLAIIGFVVMCVCALAVFMRHSGAEEEIHITQ